MGSEPCAVESSDPLVEAGFITATNGTVIPLISWNGEDETNLTVTVHAALAPFNPSKATLASCGTVALRSCGTPLRLTIGEDNRTFT
eukprot:gene3280-390_t